MFGTISTLSMILSNITLISLEPDKNMHLRNNKN